MALCPGPSGGAASAVPSPVCDRSQAAAVGRVIAPLCAHIAAAAQPDVIGAGVTSYDGRGLVHQQCLQARGEGAGKQNQEEGDGSQLVCCQYYKDI